MGAVVQEIAGGVVRIAVRAVVGAAEAELHRMRTVLLPAIAEAVVRIRIHRLAAVLVGAAKAIEVVIGIGPIAVDAVVGSEDVAIWCVATARRNADGVVRAVRDGGKAEPGIVRLCFGDDVTERGGKH